MFDLVLYLILILVASVFAGIIGSMAGLGGGVLIVPFLTLYFHVPIYLAIGASIVSVIATSSGSASAYVKDKISNIRVGTFLVLFTTTGATPSRLLATPHSATFLSQQRQLLPQTGSLLFYP